MSSKVMLKVTVLNMNASTLLLNSVIIKAIKN